MGVHTFFDERTDQSEVKARIVRKYFYAWANVVIPTAQTASGRIAYVDLYAGPGRYRDGAASTPLLVLEEALRHPKISQMLVTMFNDSDPSKTANLEAEINKIPNINALRHKPIVTCGRVDEEAQDFFASTRLIPTFTFFDRFGYKGLSLGIIKAVIKDWGCDCVFFFNYNRINAGITNESVAPHINSLFGQERADGLRSTLPAKRPDMREALILENIAQAVKEMGGRYVLPFRFKNSSGRRISHSIIFVSKHFKGYEIMKNIMWKESSSWKEGIASFEYSPADETMPLLLSLQRPLNGLQDSLMTTFAGRELSIGKLYEGHSVDTPYVLKNYQDALRRLESQGAVQIRTLRSRRPPGTYAPHLLVRFPE